MSKGDVKSIPPDKFGSSCAVRVALEQHQFGVHLEGKDGTRMPTTGRSIARGADNGRYVGLISGQTYAILCLDIRLWHDSGTLNN